MNKEFANMLAAKMAIKDYRRAIKSISEIDYETYRARFVPYRGITSNPRVGGKFSWTVAFRHGGKTICCGTFQTREEAARVYDAEIKRMGLDWPLNFPETENSENSHHT